MRREAYETLRLKDGTQFRVLPGNPITDFGDQKQYHYFVGLMDEEFMDEEKVIRLNPGDGESFEWFPVMETDDLADPVLDLVVQRAAALFRDWLHMALFNEGIQLLQNNQDPECPSICCICLDAGATWGGHPRTPR